MALRDEVYYSSGNFQLLLGYKLACVSNSYKCIYKVAIRLLAESENISGNVRWWLVADFCLSSDKRGEIYFDSFIYS